ncbi:MAG: LytR C-terminal domain-containing protein [Longimicrobiales bacterium]
MVKYVTTLASVLTGLTVILFLGSAAEQWIPGTRATLETEVFAAPPHRVRVDVQNASGVSGAARAATERLRGIGYDVVSFGNADSFGLERSVVIDRSGDLEMAAAVAQVLGLGRVDSEPDPNLFVDVTVRMGADWSPTAVPNPGSRGGGATAWLRSMLRRD